MGYKRFYLWGTVSLIGIFALIAPMITHYYSYEEQIVCGENCWVEFCMKNGNKDLYFYNKDSIPLTFEPEGKVKAVKFYQKDGRYKSGWRNINFIDPYFKGRKYVFKIPAYSARCYAMNISKEASDSLKWTFAGLDPWLIGIGQSGTNMSYEVDSCYNWTSLGDCFEVNFSRAFDQINWSDNATIHDGNYSWNFSEKGINAGNPWLFNFSNNGTVNLTVAIKLNATDTDFWQLYYATGESLLSLSFQENASTNSTNGSTEIPYYLGLMSDGNNGTFAYPNTNSAILGFWNYTKPSGATNESVWQIWHFNRTLSVPTNHTIPSVCWEESLLQFKVYSYQPDNSNNWSCYGNLNWNLVNKSTLGRVYEEQVWWEISSPQMSNLTSTSWIFFLNVSANTTELVNFSMDIYNVSQTYVNWSLQGTRQSWAFNYTLNSTQEGVY